MSNILGWLISLSVICMACILSGDISMFLDTQTLLVILGVVYGLSISVFGLQATIASVIGIKYLFHPHTVKEKSLSEIYKTKIKFSFWAGSMSLLIVSVAIGSNSEDLTSFGQVVAVALLSVVYPTLLSGLIYYPLYKKLA